MILIPISPKPTIYNITSGRLIVLFRCHQTQQSSLGAKLPKLISHRLPSSPTPTDWHIIVSDYSSRNLTHETDKLPALSGLAEVYRH